MMKKDRLLTRESGKRHLAMLGITFLVMAWTYVAMALLQRDWGWMLPLFTNVKTAKEIMAAWCCISALFVSCGLLSVAVYWNACLWMGRYLLKSLLCLVGMIPFAKYLIPRDYRSSWMEEIADLNGPEIVDTKLLSTNVAEGTETWRITEDEGASIPLIIAIPLGIVISVVKGILMCVLYLIAAICIPVCSPVVFLLALFGVSEALNVNVAATTVVCTIAFLLTTCLLVVHPVLCLKYKKKQIALMEQQTDVEKIEQ